MQVLRRRALFSGAAICLASASVFAQPAQPRLRVGFLYFGTREAAVETGRYEAFLQGLRQLGYIEGTNLSVETRFADGRADRAGPVTDELLRGKPDLIVATGSPVYQALRRSGTSIPVVVTVTVDPVIAGLAATLARPGGNFTGSTDTAELLGPKHLELLSAAVTALSQVAVLTNPTNDSHAEQFAGIAAAAQSIGKRAYNIEAGTPKDIEAAFAAMVRQRVNGLIVLGDTFFVDQLRRIADLSLAHRLPAAHYLRSFAEAGGLLSYGANLLDNFRRAAVFADKIVKGAKPGELPFEQPTRYELVINLKTARALGLSVPRSLLLRADQLIE